MFPQPLAGYDQERTHPLEKTMTQTRLTDDHLTRLRTLRSSCSYLLRILIPQRSPTRDENLGIDPHNFLRSFRITTVFKLRPRLTCL
jgi:hypothetical protein